MMFIIWAGDLETSLEKDPVAPLEKKKKKKQPKRTSTS